MSHRVGTIEDSNRAVQFRDAMAGRLLADRVVTSSLAEAAFRTVSRPELAAERRQWFPFAAVRGDSFAYLAVRQALDGAGVEFGAGAYGRTGEIAASAMVEQIHAWDYHGRPSPTIGYWLTGSSHSDLPPDTAVLRKGSRRCHDLVACDWLISVCSPAPRGCLLTRVFDTPVTA
jgi:hypothetical protein